jgi:GDP-4-dehydro-6-deoxy-D-mannose reductase
VPKLLITGHRGFVGRWIERRVTSSEPGFEGWEVANLPDSSDVRDASIASHLDAIEPDAVLHLAALSSVAESFRDPDRYFDVNFRGTLNLLRCLRNAGFGGRMLYVSTGDAYGAVPGSWLPVNEERPLRPRNPYAVSKTAAEALCYQWAQTEGLDVVIARPFNHVGPGQDVRFAVAAFARQVSQVALGKADPQIVTGDLDVTRDFTDVRDVVDAYFALIGRGVRGEIYNIGSGRETRLRDILEELIRVAGVTASITIDPTRIRADEQRRMVADVTKIERDTGWKARIPLETTLRATLEDWKRRIASE